MIRKWPANGLACVLLASGCLLTTGAAAVPGQNSSAASSTENHQPAIVHAATVRISRIEVTMQGAEPRVQIDGAGDLHYRTSRLENPNRLVLDFADATLATTPAVVPAGVSLIHSVRASQFQEDITRIVVVLDHWQPFTVLTSTKGVIVAFGTSSNAAGSQAATLQSVTFRKNGATRAPSAKKVRRAPVLPPPSMPLPEWLTKTSFALASPAQPLPPAPPAKQAQQSQPASPQQQVQQQVQQQATMTPAGTPQTTTHYSGERINVNFKDLDLLDFFRLIHEISGLNVVLDPSVKGTLTTVLVDVPWDQALDIVLKNNNLDKQLDGNVLRIATQATIKAEADQRTELMKAVADSVETVMVTRRLSYAKATKAGGAGGAAAQQGGKGMDDLLKPLLTKRGTIFGDSRTNTLIIQDIPANIPRLDDLIHQLDRKSQQVEIEARVVLASRSFAQDIGTQLGLGTGTGNGQNAFGGNSAAGTSPISHPAPGPIPPLVSAGTTSIPLLTNLSAVGATSGFTFSHFSKNFALDFMITAMESKGVGKLLSAPKVVTQNNTQGTTSQGTKIPIQTNINNTISTQYVDAVLMLKVTPQITADGTIMMDVHLENTQIDNGIPAILGQPALATQSVDNQVLAKDGETIVLGGVIVDQQSTQYNEVPLLGSVPVIGNLFKRRAVSVQSQELLFFLTPRVSVD
jgi:type IV pilus assembly protein PilQ